MIRFRDLRIRTKLTLVLVAVMLPLVIGSALTIRSMQGSLKSSSELELSNVVRLLYRMASLKYRAAASESGGAPDRPRPRDLAILARVFHETRVGKSGYPYIMDSKGNLIVHPAKAGRSIYESRDSTGRAFIKEICRRAKNLEPGSMATIRYPWRNVEEGETEARTKIVKYMYFAPWDWIVAVGAYEDDIYAPVASATRTAVSFLATSVLLAVLLIWAMSRLLARPVVRLAESARQLAEGTPEQDDFPVGGNDEMGVLGRSFTRMAREIRQQKETLERQVEARTRELAESREQYRSLVENAVDCIVTADLTGTITFANRSMERLLGIGRDEITGRKIWEFYAGGIDKARDIMAQIRQEGSIRNYEQRLLVGDRRVPIMTSATMVRDAGGEPAGTMGIFTDVTKLKELEDELSKTQVSLAQVHKLRALGDLVAGVAHEVNNPLMASTTMLRVIERGLGSEDTKLRSQLHVLEKCNERITRIVTHLREFSRQADMELKRIDINLPLSNALLISSQQLLNMQIDLREDLGEDLPVISGDANLLEQVFLDLIANARDAMEGQEGRKVLRVSSRREDVAGKPMVAVDIQDTGPGIPPDIQDKIFEPFFTTKPVGHGTGLGLPICYGIIEKHEGRIVLETDERTGTTFTILIPALPDADAGADDDEEDNG